MKTKIKNAVKTPTDFEKNVDFAFHEFGFFGINQYRIMVFFWIFELVHIPKLLADAYFGQGSTWMNMIYSHTNNFWIVSSKTPTLNYVGVYIIVAALTHPWFIVQIIKKMTFLDFPIQRKIADFPSIIFAIFIALLSSRMVDLFLDLAEILTMGVPAKSFIIY